MRGKRFDKEEAKKVDQGIEGGSTSNKITCVEYG